MQASPIKVFLGLLGVIAAIAAVVLITRPATPTPAAPAATESEDHSLTNAEAIARFKELDALRLSGYWQRSASTAVSALTSNSPIRRRVGREIQRLRRDGVIDKTTFETEAVSVLANSASSIEIQQTVLIDPKFVSEVNGEDLTERNRRQRQEIEWLLRMQGGEWLIHNATVVRANVL